MKYVITFVFALFIVSSSIAQETITDPRDKAVYKTVKVGAQTWFAENLRFKTDGAVAPKVAQANNPGLLYNWDAGQKACPSGWRVPNEDDWKVLMTTLGGKYAAGGKMKSTSALWKIPNKVSPTGGVFNAEPTGMISAGNAVSVNEGAFFWSSEAECTSGNSVVLIYNATFMEKKAFPKTDQLAVRCIKSN